MRVVESTPLHGWFRDSLEEEKMEIWVNSYHRQGVKRLAQHFVPMAFAPDGLIEGFYDHDGYNLREGKRGEEELLVLPGHTKVVVTGNNRTKSSSRGSQEGCWSWRVALAAFFRSSIEHGIEAFFLVALSRSSVEQGTEAFFSSIEHRMEMYG
ncbi:hypothetical protein ACOSP7_010863 [Xanthoceras sorbifolium]